MLKLRRGYVCCLWGSCVYKLLGGPVLKCRCLELHELYCRELLGRWGCFLLKLQFRGCPAKRGLDELCKL